MEARNVNELKELLAFGLSLGLAVEKSLADDGKISFSDVGKFYRPATKIPAAFAGIHLIPGELKDLGESERKELIDYVTTEFDIGNDRIEAVVEESLNIALGAVRIVSLLGAPKADAAAPAAATS